MAEEYDAQKKHECEVPVVREEIVEGVEVKDRGIFDFVGKKAGEEKEKEKETEHGHGHGHGHHHKHHHKHHHHGEEVIATEFAEKVNICEEEKLKGDEKRVKEKKEKKEKKHKHKLGGSDSSSSSSSDEEDGEKKKKKKEKKEKKKKEKEEKKEKEKGIEDTAVPVKKCDAEVVPPPVVEEKKGFLEIIKEKIPVVGGHAKKPEEVAPPPPPPSDFEVAAVEVPPACNEGEAIGKEKKGFLEKIKEKIPGHHPKSHEEDKEKESAAST